MFMQVPDHTILILIFTHLEKTDAKERKMTLGIGKRQSRSGGFTLAELCLALFILSLLTSLVWPSLKEFSQKLIIRSENDRLTAKLYDAREAAIVTGQPQTVFVAESPLTFFSDGSATEFEIPAFHVEKSGVITIHEESI